MDAVCAIRLEVSVYQDNQSVAVWLGSGYGWIGASVCRTGGVCSALLRGTGHEMVKKGRGEKNRPLPDSNWHLRLVMAAMFSSSRLSS